MPIVLPVGSNPAKRPVSVPVARLPDPDGAVVRDQVLALEAEAGNPAVQRADDPLGPGGAGPVPALVFRAVWADQLLDDLQVALAEAFLHQPGDGEAGIGLVCGGDGGWRHGRTPPGTEPACLKYSSTI
jgi:hypothetical protein